MSGPRASGLGPRLLFVLILAGCSFFSRTKNTFYSLERVAPSAGIAALRGTPIGIDSVQLPPGFDRREVVVRLPNQKLDVRSTQQWSASLQEMVVHTLAFDLANRLPEGMVILPGEAKPAGTIRTLDVVVEEFAAGPGNAVVLDGRWVLGGITHHERIDIDIASLESAQVADGMSRALATLADRIVAAIPRT